MKYKDLLQYLYVQYPCFQHVGKSAYVPSLQNIIDLLAIMGNPHRSVRCVHVAGTNGKGSTSHFIASILQESGCKVGLYTSPHIVDFRERIRVDGKAVTAQFLLATIEKYAKQFESIKPSLFEVTTALAFAYFKYKKVDVAVIETGLGGRLDATNVITPLLSVITNIGFDHTQILGDTLPKIAQEKAGIIKQGVPVVIGEFQSETAPVFEQVAAEKQSKLIFASKQYSISSMEEHSLGSFEIQKDGETCLQLQSGLHGLYQQKNVVTVFAAIQELKSQLKITKAAIQRGYKNVLQNTKLIGRWQIVDTKPLTICDTGHNYDGLSYTMNQLQSLGKKDVRIVWGMVSDKDISTIITLLPDDATYYISTPNIERAMPIETLKKYFAKKRYKIFKNIQEAYVNAKRCVTEDSVLYVGGSSYVVAEFFEKNHKNIWR
ncbi:MAG: bifunctional folylpolyglutamate synthase/dihydrofolate synthase [Bacteroidales bacterium]|nr:bifunctional folylpolyglutamate synthase/dihydrofolate synthase [Bacteroidales bacterium]